MCILKETLQITICCCCFSVTQSCPSHCDWIAAHQASMSLTISQNMPNSMSINNAMGIKPSSHHILWCPLFLPTVFPSIKDFYNELAVCIKWPEYWSFSFSISLSKEYSGWISLKNDWFYLLAVLLQQYR